MPKSTYPVITARILDRLKSEGYPDTYETIDKHGSLLSLRLVYRSDTGIETCGACLCANDVEPFGVHFAAYVAATEYRAILCEYCGETLAERPRDRGAL